MSKISTHCIDMAEFLNDPMAVLGHQRLEPLRIQKQNKTIFYCTNLETMHALYEKINNLQHDVLILSRMNQKSVKVKLDDL